MAAKDYIRWIRSKVGHDKIILAFAGGCIFNDQGEVLLQRRGDSNITKPASIIQSPCRKENREVCLQ